MKNENVDMFILQCLDDAVNKSLNNKNELYDAIRCARKYFGENIKDESPAVFLIQGFIMGLAQGMEIIDAQRQQPC